MTAYAQEERKPSQLAGRSESGRHQAGQAVQPVQAMADDLHGDRELADLSERSAVQRQLTVQAAFDMSPRVTAQRKSGDALASRPPIVQRQNHTGLPDSLKTGVEGLSGISLDDVRVHYNSSQAAPLRAKAFTQGTQIHVGPGHENTLGHEAWHVVQQKQGRVRPTLELRGTPINDDPSLEREADEMGSKAVQGVFVSSPVAGGAYMNAGGVAQREGDKAESSEETVSNPGDQLREAIVLLKQLALASQDKSSGEKEEPQGQIAEYIGELEEIAEGDDELLKKETLEALNSAVEQETGSSIKEQSGRNTSETAGKESTGQLKPEDGVAQRSILTWLAGLVTGAVVSTNFWLTIGGAMVVIHGYRLISKRRRLPSSAPANLYTANPDQFAAYLLHYIEGYSARNGVDEKDRKELRTVVATAINRKSKNVNGFWNEFSRIARKATWVDGNFANDTFVDNNFIVPFGKELAGLGKTIQHANVQQGDLAGFTKALKTLPFVQGLYSGKVQRVIKGQKHKGKNEAGSVTWASWKDGGKLDNSKIQEVNDGYRLVTRDDRLVKDGTFAKRVTQADRFIRTLVEPEMLARIPRPTIKVHLRNSHRTNPLLGFRAYQSGGEVHVAQDQDVSVIVHEIGHYIEDNLPLGQWDEIQQLLQKRKGASQKTGYIYPWTLEEQRFPGSYPATGKYTSKYYSNYGEGTSGSTEVTSLSVEYLSHPEKFKALIEKDPQQAALILRILKPNEFQAAVNKKSTKLRGYVNKYLPR